MCLYCSARLLVRSCSELNNGLYPREVRVSGRQLYSRLVFYGGFMSTARLSEWAAEKETESEKETETESEWAAGKETESERETETESRRMRQIQQ